MIIYKVQFYEYNTYSYSGVMEGDAEYFQCKKAAKRHAKDYVDSYINDFGNKVKCPIELIPSIEEIQVN